MSLALLAPAKVNLGLAVGPPRGGYHPLESVVQAIPGDVLHAEPAARDALRIVGPHGGGLGPDTDNLVLRAVTALRSAGYDVPGISFVLDKRIPAAAGLGGGSGDAAGALVAAATLFDLDADLEGIGATVGSDVPALVRGGTVHMAGRGELVTSMPFLGDVGLLVLVPSFGLSTAAVYGRFDELGFPTGREVVDVPPAFASLAPLRNDLTPAAESLDPRVTAHLATLSSVLDRPALLSGSGSAMFACFSTVEEAEEAVSVVRPRLEELDPGYRLLQACAPLDSGPLAI